MNRYQLVAYEEASPETRAIYDDFLRCTGSSAVPHWLKSLGASPVRHGPGPRWVHPTCRPWRCCTVTSQPCATR